MTTTDPTTLALTGQLPFILILGTLLAFPLSFLLLSRYRRAVLKGMNQRSERPAGASKAEAAERAVPEGKPDDSLKLSIIDAAAKSSVGPAGEALYRRACSSPWWAALVYLAGGTLFAAVMTLCFLQSSSSEILPMRFLILLWTYAWPLVLTLSMVTAARWRTKLLLIAAYGSSYMVIGFVALLRSPDSSIGQILILWLVTNMPPTLVILLFLIRRVRAIGPLVVAFMLLALSGTTILLSAMQHNQSILQTVVNLGYSMGLGGMGLFWSLYLISFIIFTFPGWYLLAWIRHQYREKWANDRSLLLDSLWFLSGLSYAIGLVFEGAVWILSGLAAFAAYKLTVRFGFSFIDKTKIPSPPARLLMLRVFSLGRRSEALFDSITRHWRYLGHVQLITGPDLATTTMDPDEFFDIMSGKLGNHFVEGPESLASRVSGMDRHPDFDGRYRINEFFCYDDTWQMTLSRLVEESDVVMMDLRGFTSQNSGCTYEVHELVSSVPLDRMVVVIDGTTDRPFFEQTLKDAWEGMRRGSPNQNGPGEVRIVQLNAGDAGLSTLLRMMCAAADTSPSGSLEAAEPVKQ